MRFKAVAVSIFFLGCGERPKSASSLSPLDAFSTYAVPTPASVACDATVQANCANIEIFDSSVGGMFVFNDLEIKCQKNANNISLGLVNSSTHPTFFLAINVTSSSVLATGTTILCEGAKLDSSKEPLKVLVPDYCTVSVSNHNRVFYASENEACTIVLDSLSPMQGKISCPQLSSGGEEFSLVSTSKFVCPKE